MSILRAAIFDLDETLLDRTASLFDFVSWQATNQLRLDDPARFIERFIELDNYGRVWKDQVYSTLLEEFDLHGWTATELLSVYELTFCTFAKPKPGAVETVRQLHQLGFKIGLISNGHTPFQERNFRALGLEPFFDSILVSEAVGLRKPDPAIFLKGCQALGCVPGEAVFYGDNPAADIGGAKNAGLRTVFVTGRQNLRCEDADWAVTVLSAPFLIS